MRRSVQRSAVFAGALLMFLGSVVALTTSTASARPINHSVTQTAFIWNCPTGTPGCSAVQTRVGDVRTQDTPITDVCRVPLAGVPKNLVFNRTDRTGAADRTGFLFRSNLSSPNLQMDSCITGGSFNNAPVGVIQRLCPFLTCGRVGTITSNQITLREFCAVFNEEEGVSWHLTVALDTATNGPLTAGFIHEDDLNNHTTLQDDCERPF